MKRSAALKIQNSMVARTQNANRQRKAASRWPSRYGQDDEVAALNEIPPGKVLGEIARAGVPESMPVIPHAKLRGATCALVAPPAIG